MKTHLQDPSKRLVWLRLGMITMVLFGVITLLLMTNSTLPVEAAPELTLQPGDLLIVTPDGGCNLQIRKSSQFRANLGCEAFTPTATATVTETATATATATETATATATATGGSGLLDSGYDQVGTFKFTSDVVTAPEAKIRRSIKPGKRLAALALVNACKLKVVQDTAALIRIKCKPLPTPTVTPTNTRVPTPKPGNGPDGRWEGMTDQGRPVLFFVTDNRTSWNRFVFRALTPSCYIDIGVYGPGAIQNNQLSVSGNLSGQFTGSFALNGTFSTNTYIKGVYSYDNIGYPGCGSVTRNGQWDAHWKSVSIAAPAPVADSISGPGWYVTVTPR